MLLMLPSLAYFMLVFSCLGRATSQTPQSASFADLMNAIGKKFDAMDKKIDPIRNVVRPETAAASTVNCETTPTMIEGKSCADLYKKGFKTDGVYTIDPDGLGSFRVRCDMTTAGGGWTVFQRRVDGSVNFFRDWYDYKNGFGSLRGEFWLGLDKINRLTRSIRVSLRIDMEDTSGNKKYAKYSFFTVSSERSKYKLSLGTYSGTAGDGLSRQKGMAFSTRDVDNDSYAKGSCANGHKGAWWYAACHNSNLNGLYYHGSHKSFADGINWYPWKGYNYSLKKTEMKLRSTGFPSNK